MDLNVPSRPPPAVPTTGPDGAFLVELLVFNGAPFHDHWAYFVRSHGNSDTGTLIHAAGNVRVGFEFQIKRSHDLREPENLPTKRIALQWVDKEYVSENAIATSGDEEAHCIPACAFEEVVHRVKVPIKSLRAVDDKATAVPRRIIQRDCQTWMVESAEELVKEHIFSAEVAAYLRAIQQ
ncbi:hypothetical protein BJY01DRAFT_219941 [Aspergillus pseudoustus]|uniref:Uncharacterized protein n=1 Tax=Aspergillus pseudoustus TaxID=1810923 RepID=A0ABR4JET7_9EURO